MQLYRMRNMLKALRKRVKKLQARVEALKAARRHALERPRWQAYGAHGASIAASIGFHNSTGDETMCRDWVGSVGLQ